MSISSYVAAALAVAGTTFAGCARRDPGAAPAPQTETAPAPTAAQDDHPGPGMMSGMCPMKVPGTRVTSTDIEGGVALEFKTDTGDVAELRERVRHMAAMHDQHHRGGGGMMGEPPMPPTSASVVDIEGGARLVLRPNQPGDLDALRSHARMRAERMAQGDCPRS